MRQLGPHAEDHGEHRRHEACLTGDLVGADADLALGLERQEDRTVRGEQAESDQSAEQAVRVEQREQVAGELAVAVLHLKRHAGDDVGERDTPEQRGQERSDEDRDVPVLAPARTGRGAALAAVLERHAADDQRDEDEQ